MRIYADELISFATTSGHIVRLEPGVPQDLADALAYMAMQRGAKLAPADGSEDIVVLNQAVLLQPKSDSEPVLVPSKVPPTRHERLVAVMLDIIARGSQDEFRQDRSPKASIVNKLFGEAVLEEERTAAWEAALRK